MTACPVTSDHNRELDRLDADARIESRRDEIVQEMLETDRAFVEAEFSTDVYDLSDDVCLKIYERHGHEITKFIGLLLQSSYLDSRRIKSDSKAALREQITKIKFLAHERLIAVCERAAKSEHPHA